MKALVLYVILVATGAFIAAAIGYGVEMSGGISWQICWFPFLSCFTIAVAASTLSLLVFLLLFFANFVVSWIAVIYIMDGSFADADGRLAQLEIERAQRD
jgi:hypothetical protein